MSKIVIRTCFEDPRKLTVAIGDVEYRFVPSFEDLIRILDRNIKHDASGLRITDGSLAVEKVSA